MKRMVFIVGGALASVVAASAFMAPATTGSDGFTLSKYVPSHVFMFVAERNNPKGEFIHDYWGEVVDALMKSGVSEEVMGLVGKILGAEGTTEVQRLKDRAMELLAGVELGGKENAFAEVFSPPTNVSSQIPPIMAPQLVWMVRRDDEAAAKRGYDSVVAILDVLVDEINRARGTEAMVTAQKKLLGATVTSVDLLQLVPGAPFFPISVAHRDDIVVIAFREKLLNDCLALMDGSSTKETLAANARFKSAFAQLPPPEDMMTFFDMQGLMNPMRDFVDKMLDQSVSSHDVTKNTKMSGEVGELNGKAIEAYRRGDIAEALSFVEKAQEAGGDNSIVMYNLACFNSMLGNESESLKWLERAVEGGFYAPGKIAGDSDLDNVRGKDRYKAILAKAGELARSDSGKDVILNSATSGEVVSLRNQIKQSYEKKDYEHSLRLAEQAFAIAPKDSQVLYILGCMHKLLGHEDRGLDFLAQAVDGGFYCPNHISKDSDWDGLHDDKRYEAALAKAQKKAAAHTVSERQAKIGIVKILIDRIADSVTIMDYSAAVQMTDGYSTKSETISVLVEGAEDRPIYAVFGNRKPLTDFARFIPLEAESFSIAGGFDLQEFYKFLEDTVRLAGPDGEELLGKWAALQEQIGVDIHRDLLDWIDGDSINVTLAGGAGTISMLKVNDEETAKQKISAVIDFVSTKIPELAAKNPMLASLAMLGLRSSPLEHEKLSGFNTLHVGMSPEPAIWGTAEGYLVFGSSADAVALCLATAKGEHPSIKENPIAMAEAIVPTEPFVAVSLTDLRKAGDEAAMIMGAISMGAGMAGAFIPEPKVQLLLGAVSRILGKLVPVARKVDFFKSSAAEITFNGRMWRMRSVTHYFSPEERAAKTAAATAGKQ